MSLQRLCRFQKAGKGNRKARDRAGLQPKKAQRFHTLSALLMPHHADGEASDLAVRIGVAKRASDFRASYKPVLLPNTKPRTGAIAFRAVTASDFTDNRYKRFGVPARYGVVPRHDAKTGLLCGNLSAACIRSCGISSRSGRARGAWFAFLTARSARARWARYSRKTYFALWSAWARWPDRAGRPHLTSRSGSTNRTLQTRNSLWALRSNRTLRSLNSLRTRWALRALLWLITASRQREYQSEH